MKRFFTASVLSCLTAAGLLGAVMVACGGGGGRANTAAAGGGNSNNGLGSLPTTVGALMDGCTGEFSADFRLKAERSAPAVPPLARPPKGHAFSDPLYRTCVVRVTDHANEAPQGFARNDYSRRQAFNADNSLLLVYAYDGAWHLYDARTFAHVHQLDGPAADAEPQWDAKDPALLYFLPTNGGLELYELNVMSGAQRVAGDFRGRLPWPDAARLWTKSEGSPSADGRYWAFMAETDDFQPRGFVVWDRIADRIVSTRSNDNRPDHLSMSPSGRHVVVSWMDRVVSYDRELRNPRQLQASSEHSDIALDANGDDLYVSVDYQSNDGTVFMVNLRTGRRTDLFPTYLRGTATALHFSGKAYGTPGWVLVSTYGDYGGALQWLHRKIFAVQLASNPRIYPLAHTHVTDRGYWSEPQASVNRDFSRVVFTSNWGGENELDVDAYMIRLPREALRP